MATLQACSTVKKDNTLLGKWTTLSTSNSDKKTTLAFVETGGQFKFEATNLLEMPISGTFEKQNSIILLSYFPNETHTIDSLTIETINNGQVSRTYFEENQVVLTETGDSKISNSNEVILESVKVQDEKLTFSFNDEVYQLEKIEETTQTNVTFLSIFRGIGGILSLILIAWLFSTNRKKIDWSLVIKGTLLQIVIALLILKVPFIEDFFRWLSELFVGLIGYTNKGVNFLFAPFGIDQIESSWVNFAITVLPTIIFFSALTSVLYYLGILQRVVFLFAWLMKKLMRLSGAESLAAAGNIFLGQTEAPLLVKPYLMGMTKSELMCLMTGGMATIAGGVLAAYINFLGGDDPVQQAYFAKHLITASLISAPAAIVAAKILIPETEEINKNLTISKDKIGVNILEAISNGTSDGLKLAINVGAMLLVFISLMALGNGVLAWVGDISGLNPWIAANTPYESGLSFQFLLGYIGAPVVWLIGVEFNDLIPVGELLGQKTVLNEFIAYVSLDEMRSLGKLSEKSVIMSTYILCGFANFASIGIQIGGIGSLIPTRKGLLSSLGMRALLAGTIASLSTAAIVGMFY